MTRANLKQTCCSKANALVSLADFQPVIGAFDLVARQPIQICEFQDLVVDNQVAIVERLRRLRAVVVNVCCQAHNDLLRTRVTGDHDLLICSDTNFLKFTRRQFQMTIAVASIGPIGCPRLRRIVVSQ